MRRSTSPERDQMRRSTSPERDQWRHFSSPERHVVKHNQRRGNNNMSTFTFLIIFTLLIHGCWLVLGDENDTTDQPGNKPTKKPAKKPIHQDEKHDSVEDVQFQLYTRLHPVTPQNLSFINNNNSINFNNLSNSDGWLRNFFLSKPTIIVTHGFMGSADSEVCRNVRDAHLYMDDVNVVIVHWEALAKARTQTSYDEAVSNTAVVGQKIATFIDYIMNKTPTLMDNIHLIGFSLGAHVMGQAGHKVTTGKVGRITGLDPAKPMFEKKALSDRLDSTDAKFVFVIHTETQFVGFKSHVGHADFYPNGGASPQPACKDNIVAVHCSHQMAFRYYVSSVYHPGQFVAQRCDSWLEYVNMTAANQSCSWNQTAVMGPETDHSVRGLFYLRTLDEPPYSVTSDPSIHEGHTNRTVAWYFWDMNATDWNTALSHHTNNSAEHTANRAAQTCVEVLILVASVTVAHCFIDLYV